MPSGVPDTLFCEVSTFLFKEGRKCSRKEMFKEELPRHVVVELAWTALRGYKTQQDTEGNSSEAVQANKAK